MCVSWIAYYDEEAKEKERETSRAKEDVFIIKSIDTIGKLTYANSCITKKTTPNVCSQLFIKESSIEKAFVDAIKVLVGEIETLKSTLKKNITTALIYEDTKEINNIIFEVDKL